MNFSKSSKLRKILSLLLVMTMLLTLIAGCKKDDNTPETNAPNVGPSLIDPAPSQAETEPTETQPVEINENMATVLNQINIRSAPTTESVVIGNLYAGDKVEVSRRESLGGVNWAYITSPQAGWIVMDYVQMDFPTDTPTGPDTSTPAGQDSTDETKPADGNAQSRES